MVATQTCFNFLPGEMIQVDERAYFSDGLIPIIGVKFHPSYKRSQGPLENIQTSRRIPGSLGVWMSRVLQIVFFHVINSELKWVAGPAPINGPRRMGFTPISVKLWASAYKLFFLEEIFLK